MQNSSKIRLGALLTVRVMRPSCALPVPTKTAPSSAGSKMMRPWCVSRRRDTSAQRLSSITVPRACKKNGSAQGPPQHRLQSYVCLVRLTQAGITRQFRFGPRELLPCHGRQHERVRYLRSSMPATEPSS